MKKARVGLTAIALLALAAPFVSASENESYDQGIDRGKFQAVAYNLRYVEPGPRIPPMPKDPEAAAARSGSGAVLDAAGAAVGFSSGRPQTRTAREVERDTIRKTIRRLG